MTEPGASELDLRGYLRILRRRLWVLVLVPVIVTGASVAASEARTPKYRSTAELLLARTQAESIFDPLRGQFVDPNRLLANQIRVVRSQEVTDLATERLGYPAAITATASSTEDVITLRAVDIDARRAAAIANAYAEAYLEYRRSSGASENETAQTELRRQIDDAQGRLDALDREVAARPAAQRTALRATQLEERQAVVAQLADQRSQLSQLEAAANVGRGGVQLLAPASVPREPFEPNTTRNGMVALAVGLMLGLALALALDYLDSRVRTKEDVERLTGGLPVVGMVPILAGWRNRKATHVAAIEEPNSGSAEAYRALRTSIQFLGLDRSLRTIQITSPATSEGKTTTLVNLAVSLAQAGQRVVVVDCDLRRPRVHSFFQLSPDVGFTSVLVGDVALSQALQRVEGVDGLRVLVAGPIPPNPSELLSGRRTIEILATLQADADVVLIDSPPVLPVSDAAALSTRVDGTLLVVSANATHRKQLVRTLELLRQVEAVVIGTVLNRAGERGGGYGYGYRYGYGEQPSPKEPAPRKQAKPKRGRRPKVEEPAAG